MPTRPLAEKVLEERDSPIVDNKALSAERIEPTLPSPDDATAPTEPVSEPLFISTEEAVDEIRKAEETEERLAGVSAQIDSDQIEDTDEDVEEIDKPKPKEPEPKKSTFVNPDTGQEFTFTEFDQADIDFIKKERLEFAEGDVPNFLVGREKREASEAEEEVISAKDRLKNFDVSNNPTLKKQLENITSVWDARVKEMEDINKRREKSFETLGFRIGAQFTGGVRGGIFGGVISEEERQGSMRISELEAKKQDALSKARQAFETQKWDEYVDLIDLAQDDYNKQLSEVEKLQKAQAKQNEKISKEKRDLQFSSTIADAFDITTDTADVFKIMKAAGFNTTLKEVDEALEILEIKEETEDFAGTAAVFRTFKQFFPDIDTATPEGLKEFLNFKTKFSEAGRKPETPDVTGGVLGDVTRTDENDLVQSGLSESESNIQNYFLNTPSEFRDLYKRDFAAGVVSTDATLADLIDKYTAWYNEKTEGGDRGWAELFGE